MASFFRIISMFWPCQGGQPRAQMKVAAMGKRQFGDNYVCWALDLKGPPAHLTPGTIWGLATAAGLGQLLDAVIDCNTALPWYQVLFRYLYPAQRAD